MNGVSLFFRTFAPVIVIIRFTKILGYMKHFFTTVLLAAVLPLTLVGCKDDATPAQQPETPAEETAKTAEEVLSKIPGVIVIQNTTDAKGVPVTYFYFEQAIDHEDASAGTFLQYCALHYKGPDHLTVLHTQGYSTLEPEDFQQVHLATNLDANYIEVEHRYYRRSLVNFVAGQTDCTGDYWKYNTAAQSTADLHAVVTALKATGCFKNKWVSTGNSKNGILTALYAYFYPNEMDVYVPFCAPFCVGKESEGVGKWQTQRSGLEDGKNTELRNHIWAAFRRMANDANLQNELAALYNLDHHTNYSVKGIMPYLLYTFMENMFYKFSYFKTSEWDAVIPQPEHSAEIYYRFTMLGRKDFQIHLNELRRLVGLENIEIDSYDDDSEYLVITDDESSDVLAVGRRVAPQYLELDRLIRDIYFVHAAKELGYFAYDFSVLPEDHLLSDKSLSWIKSYGDLDKNTSQYGVTFDDGKLMKNFLEFVRNNRYNNKCKMLFIYGGNDPWSGAALPDPDADDHYVKKHMVPNGLHSLWINSQSHYPTEEREWIMNAVNEMLQ